ncbi:MAG: EamA-like transporter family protein [Candidatus Lokiarchaeum sp. GC14_75]|nr:MAG: EamA-like transporter family protein [Candidatus Lokiarchaeum sp. GC14_75]
MYGEIAAILTVMSFALAFVLARRIENDFTPIFQNAIKSIIGFFTFFVITLILGALFNLVILPINVIIMLILSITFTVILGDTTLLHTQRILGPTKALAIANTSPFFTFIFAAVFLGRSVTIQMVISGILIGVGVIIITKRENSNEHEFEKDLIQEKTKNTRKTTKGVLLGLFVSISLAIGMSLSEYSIGQTNQILGLGILSTMLAMVVRFFFALIVLSSVVIIKREKTVISKSRSPWGILILSGILSYTFGSILFGEAVHIVGASFMSLISAAMPLFTIPFSYIINKEKLSRRGFLGVSITIIGVLLILF